MEFVKDRPGHDIRYSLSSARMFKESGWAPKCIFEKGLRITILWCLRHRSWLLKKWKNISTLYK